MDQRTFLELVSARGQVITIDWPVDPCLELAAVSGAIEDEAPGRIVRFRHVIGSEYEVVTGLCADRGHFAAALGCTAPELIFRLAAALADPQPPPVVPGDQAPCQEVIEPTPDLETIPFLTHWASDAGPYATAAVLFTNDPDTGANASFHRVLRLGPRHAALRLVERRGTDTALRKTRGDLPVAICIGLPLHVLLAASMAPPPGVDELTIAQALAPTPLARCHTNDVLVPAAAEVVIEGRLTHRLTAEGPFVDLTQTLDFVRQQPLLEVDCITHRRRPIYHALLPGRLEHRLLMGMPREPTIFREVNQVCRCLNVNITPGGASWLHAVVQIDKQTPDDGLRAIEAAFRGHSSLKHIVVVDRDIDPFNPADVEWAIATRFQAGQGLHLFPSQPSSSLDPSAVHIPGQKSRSDKLGVDATMFWSTPTGPREPAAYQKVTFPPVDLSRYRTA
jgi:UbiD family decarboxylase